MSGTRDENTWNVMVFMPVTQENPMVDEMDSPPPLVVDLDGTLIQSDSLWEALFHMALHKPWCLFLLPFWLTRGRAFLKARLAPFVADEVEHWPLNPEVMNFLMAEKVHDRRLILATAAPQIVADAMAKRLDVFDMVLTSDEYRNLKGEAKLGRLLEEFGEKGFDYIGDSRADLPVWRHCHNAVMAGRPGSRLAKLAGEANPNLLILENPPFSLHLIAKSLRLHQWAKNLLLLVPLFINHDFAIAKLFVTTIGFLTFSLFASAVYILNDLADLSHDRRHQDKRNRPFASGNLPLQASIPLFLIPLAAGVGLIRTLPPRFGLFLMAYFLLTFLYSFWLKRLLMLDVIVLSAFYTLRVMVGAVMLDLPISNWLIGFSCFIFLGLSCLKRSSELRALAALRQEAVHGRAYQAADLGIMETFGVACGFSAVVILALYVESMRASRHFSHPSFLWCLCPLIIYWFGRLVILSHRGGLRQDPVGFALADRNSWCCALAVAALVLVAA